MTNRPETDPARAVDRIRSEIRAETERAQRYDGLAEIAVIVAGLAAATAWALLGIVGG